jgi:D-sedoheptulose 7-phosphate isomerase
MKGIIEKRIRESIALKEDVLANDNIKKQIERLSLLVLEAFKNGKKLIFAGNGGSFSDSFHLSGEFVSRFLFDRPALPSIALGGNNSIVTAIGNDYSYEDIFSRELFALGNIGDVFIPISTSGNSKNIINSINTAKKKGIVVFGLTGEGGGKMKDICNCICVPSNDTARIQEVHILIGHIICELVEKTFFEKS